MREIKFRAWNPVSKMMFEVDGIDLKKKSLLRIDRNPWNVDVLDGWKGKDGYKLMQYTDLKDKNGKEIYEGDVVKTLDGDLRDPDSALSEVRWSSEGYRCCWWLEGRSISLSVGVVTDLLLEVVGNIYENPELITSS